MARTARLALEIDSRGARRGASEADRELRQLKKSASDTVSDLKRLSGSSEEVGRSARRGAGGLRDMSQATAAANAGFLRTRVSASGLATSFVALRNAAGVLAAVQLGGYFLSVSDRAKRMDGQLRLAAGGLASFNVNQAAVRRIAEETRSGLEVTSELYGKFARNAQDVGRTQKEAETATASFAKALKISNASAADAAQITRQFGQALASGVLRGDEFNSIMEGGPRIARLLADSLGRTTGELRAMAENGELTGERIYAALTDRKFTAALDEEMKLVPKTWDEAVQKIKDASMITFSAFDRGGEFSNMLIEFVTGGTTGFADLELRAEDFGMTVRETIGGLTSVWDGFYDYASAAFADIAANWAAVKKTFGIGDTGPVLGSNPLRDSFREVDKLTGWVAGKFNDDGQGLLGKGIRAGWLPKVAQTNFVERYDTGAAGQRRTSEARKAAQDKLDAADDAVRTDAQRYAAQKRARDVAAAAAAKSRGGSSKRDPNAEVGRDWSAQEVANLLKSGGFRVTGVDRTAAQQQAQIDKWKAQEAVRKGSGGLRPAAVGTSAHELGKGVDIGKEHSIASVRSFLKSKGVPIKQLINEGDHKHLGIGGGAGGRGGKSDADREADKAATLAARKIENEKKFVEQLKQEADTAAMLPLEAARYNAESKLRAIINEGNLGTEIALTTEQTKQIEGELARKNLGEFRKTVAEGLLADETELRALTAENAALASSTAKTEEVNLKVVTAGLKVKEDALAKGLELTDATVVQAVAEAEARARTNAELAKKNALIRAGNAAVDEAIERGMSPTQRRQKEYDDAVASVGNSTRSAGEKDSALKQLNKEFAQDMGEIRKQFFDDILSDIEQVGDAIGGSFGKALSAALSIGTIFAQMNEANYQAGTVGAGANNPISKVASGLKGMSDTFRKGLSDPNSPLGQGLSKISAKLGKASDGAAMGSQIATLAKAVGFKKFSSTGAQVGGAIGSFIPIPGGQIIGSIVGGIAGGLLKKTKQGKATLTGVDGDASLGGNDAGMKKAAGGAAKSVQEGLRKISDQLGGTGFGAFKLAIGQRHGDWRVNTSGGSLKKKKGAKDFDDDEAGAIMYAIAAAIKDGALKGLSPVIQKIMQNAGEDIEKGLADALSLTGAFRELKGIKNPVGLAMEDLNKQFQNLADILRKAGGNTEEFAQIEELYQIKRLAIIEGGNNSSIKAMKDYLFELSGGTNSVLSPELRFQNSKAELDKLDATRAAGGKVDFGQYQSISDAFLSASRDSKGSGLEFFSDMARVTGTISDWIESERTAAAVVAPPIDFTPVVGAVNTQTTVTTELLTNIRDTLVNNGAGGGGGETRGSYTVGVASPRYFELAQQ